MKTLELNKADSFDAQLSIKAEKPTYKVIKDDKGTIIDYQDVRIEGYANTFNLDRGGDQVVPGAFAQHLSEFLSNPVLLVDHIRETGFAAGQVHTAYEDEVGLKITATLSNSPSEKMRDIRFKVAEGVLRTFSIGGRFHGKAMPPANSDADPIFFVTKVELREVSIVTVPMNKESLFEVKDEPEKQNLQESVSENMKFELVDDEPESPLIEIDGQLYEITN